MAGLQGPSGVQSSWKVQPWRLRSGCCLDRVIALNPASFHACVRPAVVQSVVSIGLAASGKDRSLWVSASVVWGRRVGPGSCWSFCCVASLVLVASAVTGWLFRVSVSWPSLPLRGWFGCTSCRSGSWLPHPSQDWVGSSSLSFVAGSPGQARLCTLRVRLG
jgi:hypothetical protein